MSKPELTIADFAGAAQALGCDVPSIQCVTDVEAPRGGFLPDGRPRILFERHVMYKRLLLEAGLGEAVHFAVASPDIVNRTPGGYATGPTPDARGAAEHERMGRAAQINRGCALESASWGRFQIMGFHWEALHYTSLQAFVNAMYDSEAAHLDAFVRFVRLDPPLQRALQSRDWATFARRYNGPDFRKSAYDMKLGTAYLVRKKEHDNAMADR